MNALEVSNLVHAQLQGLKENKYGWKFRAFLVEPPILEVFRAPNGVSWQAWVVLRESDNGYAVAYDEEDGMFCLATGGVIVSSYETIMDVLNGM